VPRPPASWPGSIERSRQCGQSAWRAATGSRSTDPADEPVEQPSTFELAINLQAAKAIGF
jgi:hypothetical protein